MDLPVQITTRKRQVKKVQIDGFDFLVRRPGAGEALTYRQLGREITKLEAKAKLTPSEQEAYEELRARSMAISLNLFDSLGNAEAKEYIDTLEITVLLETITQIFGGAEIDESGTETSSTVS